MYIIYSALGFRGSMSLGAPQMDLPSLDRSAISDGPRILRRHVSVPKSNVATLAMLFVIPVIPWVSLVEYDSRRPIFALFGRL